MRPSNPLMNNLVYIALTLLLGVGEAVAQMSAPGKLPGSGPAERSAADQLQKGDEAFIRDAIAKYGSREAGSRALAAQGWVAFRSGNLEAALQRFNDCRLLDPKNYGAYWGIGAVLGERGKLAEALEQLERANELNDDRSQRVALLTDLGAVHSEYATRLPNEKQLDRAHHFVLANQRFTESLEIDPNNAAAWREWAISLYRQERYSEAWIKAKRAMELKSEPFPPGFLKVLESKLRESK